MTRTFSDGHPKVLPACNFLSQYYFYNIFLQPCRFSLQTLTKFEAAKTGSGVGFLRLTAVWLARKDLASHYSCSNTAPGTELKNDCVRAKLGRQNSICHSFVLIFCSVSSMFCLSDLCQELNGFIVIVRFT